MRPGDSVAPEPHLCVQPAEQERKGEPAATLTPVRTLVEVLKHGSAARQARAAIRDVLRKADVKEDRIADVEMIVAELAANAERYATEPYELQILSVHGVPVWCEIVDGSPDLERVAALLDRLRTFKETDLPLLAENGRGLLIAHKLAGGDCEVYPTGSSSTGVPGKAVGFALPTAPSGRWPMGTTS
ncbi:ATP-binding protein [Sphaerisporangium viridialbum]|uniref:ATP-binding protein n=1 Tax=Sphaerisporangium viridialbum TaxID=46189 RepID=UPI003C743C68